MDKDTKNSLEKLMAEWKLSDDEKEFIIDIRNGFFDGRTSESRPLIIRLSAICLTSSKYSPDRIVGFSIFFFWKYLRRVGSRLHLFEACPR